MVSFCSSEDFESLPEKHAFSQQFRTFDQLLRDENAFSLDQTKKEIRLQIDLGSDSDTSSITNSPLRVLEVVDGSICHKLVGIENMDLTRGCTPSQ